MLPKTESGFTLIEVIVTATFLGIVVVSLAQLFISTEGINRESRNVAIATQLAQKKIETLRNTSFASLTAGTENFSSELPPALGAPKSASTVTTDEELGLKRIEVKIQYYEKTKPQTIELSTLIAERGISK